MNEMVQNPNLIIRFQEFPNLNYGIQIQTRFQLNNKKKYYGPNFQFKIFFDIISKSQRNSKITNYRKSCIYYWFKPNGKMQFNESKNYSKTNKLKNHWIPNDSMPNNLKYEIIFQPNIKKQTKLSAINSEN